MPHPPILLQVDNAHLSVATLTDEPLSKMVSIDSAPKIMAVVVGKGADYASAEGYSDGLPRMPQVCGVTWMDVSRLYRVVRLQRVCVQLAASQPRWTLGFNPASWLRLNCQ